MPLDTIVETCFYVSCGIVCTTAIYTVYGRFIAPYSYTHAIITNQGNGDGREAGQREVEGPIQ